MKTKRGYTMGARAEAVEQTRLEILRATFELAQTRLISDISLDTVAQAAGVSVQTVLRQFRSRAQLLQSTIVHANEVVSEERRVPVGDTTAGVRSVVDHYERRGDAALMMLAQEGSDDLMATVTATGRKVHRDWVEAVFAPHLHDATDQDELADLLVVATDVYTWKLLRRDRGLSRARTEERMQHLVAAVLATGTGKDD